MKCRDFSIGCGAALAASALVLPSAQAQTTAPAQMQGKKPELGADYLKLEQRAQVEAPAGKIEVIEFFWYSCPHCSVFEPTFDAWSKSVPKDVVVRRVPIAFRDDFAPQQRLFYALEAMGLLEQLHRKVFAAIHNEKATLSKPADISAFMTKNGVDGAKFVEVMNSFSMQSKVLKSRQIAEAFKLDGVPALGIQGQFLTSGSIAGTPERALLVTDSLIQRSRKA